MALERKHVSRSMGLLDHGEADWSYIAAGNFWSLFSFGIINIFQTDELESGRFEVIENLVDDFPCSL